MKKILLLAGGICFLALAIGCGILLVCYVAGGAGLQIFSFGLSSGSVLVGLIHVVGLAIGCFLCFMVGICLCASGLVSHPKSKEDIIVRKP